MMTDEKIGKEICQSLLAYAFGISEGIVKDLCNIQSAFGIDIPRLLYVNYKKRKDENTAYCLRDLWSDVYEELFVKVCGILSLTPYEKTNIRVHTELSIRNGGLYVSDGDLQFFDWNDADAYGKFLVNVIERHEDLD